jgi:ABC-type transport system involved in multi-copper enzyme maturation permease subunit
MFLVDQIPGMALLIGVTLSAGVMGTGVQLAGSATLVAGAIGLFGYLTGTLIHFFEDSLGVPLVLLIAAVVMIALAAAVVRLRRPGAPPTGS